MAKTKLQEGEESLFDQILDDIASGKIVPGTRLKVAELALNYGTSTTPVREVLRQLQGQGILQILPNKGAVVPKISADTVRDIHEVLVLLEPYFVSWFAETAGPAQIDALRAVQAQIETVRIEDRVTFSKLDTAFHQTITRHHYNGRAVDTWTIHRTALQAFSCQIPISPSRHRQVLVEHQKLIDACARNDVTAALEIAEEHGRGAGENMSRQLRAAR